jgi:serine/threonine-protein kinase
LAEGQITELVTSGLDLLKPEDLANELVKRELITKYQADQLLSNRLEKLDLGPYRLLRPIGAGGMGEVYLALQKKLERNVAIKVLRPDFATAHATALARFRREALAVARLAHPNIVHIYDADEIDGNHFIVMEYVPGVDLWRFVEERGPLPIDMACDFMRQAALGLQHAHEHGLVHRDIKPSNLLVVVPEKPAPGNFGCVKILDLGLARIQDETGGLTMTRVRCLLGTPDFISPEQAQNSSDVDIRADLYSLGCTLHYLLCGQVPFPGRTPIEKLMCHHLDSPMPIRLLREGVPPKVQEILERLLKKKPEERYATPGDLVTALAEAASSYSIEISSRMKAKPPTPSVEAPRTGLASGLSRLPDIAPPPKKAPSSLLQKTNFGDLPTVSPPSQAAAPTQISKLTPLEALKLPEPHKPQKPSKQDKSSKPEAACRVIKATDLPQLGMAAAVVPLSAPRVAVLQGHTAPVLSLAYDRNGRFLASGGLDQSVRLWRLDEDNTRQESAFQNPRMGEVRAICFLSSNELLISTTGFGGRIWTWSWRNTYDQSVKPIDNSSATSALAVSPDGQCIAAGSRDSVKIWTMSSRGGLRLAETLPTRGGEVTALAFSNCGQRFVSGDNAGRIIVWERGRRGSLPVGFFHAHSSAITALSPSPDGRRLASGSRDNLVKVCTRFDNVQQIFSVSAGLRGCSRRLTYAARYDVLISVTDAGQVLAYGSQGEVLNDWRLSQTISSCQSVTDDGTQVALGRTDGSIGIYALRRDAPAYSATGSVEMQGQKQRSKR